jgi:polyketide cyclase/dehydrase/lipid transport protein
MHRLDRDEVRLRIDAPPEMVYDLVSDVPRTPEWSPEVIACRWLGGATRAVPGARFSARNKKKWFGWSNRPVVETAERAREFAIVRTEPSGGTIRWYYRLEPAADGTMAVLGYQVLKAVPRTLHVMVRVLLGVRDLRTDLHQNMITSLGRIAEIAAGQEPGRPSAATARTS